MIKPASRHVLIIYYACILVTKYVSGNSVTQLLEGHTCCDITRSDSLDMDWLRKAYKFHVLGF